MKVAEINIYKYFGAAIDGNFNLTTYVEYKQNSLNLPEQS